MAENTNFTTDTHAVMIPELWANEAQLETESKLVAAPLVKRFDDLARGSGYGDKIHIPQVSNFGSTFDVSQVEKVTRTVPATEDEVELELDQHKGVSYFVPDRLSIQAKNVYLREYSRKAGYEIAKDVDTALLDNYAELSQSVGDENTQISRENWVAARNFLDRTDAPVSGRFAILHPDAFADILDLDEATLYTGVGVSPAPIVTGLVGELLGIPLYISSNIQVAAGTPEVVHNIMGQEEVWALAIQLPMRLQSDKIIEEVGTLYVADVLYGETGYRDTFGVDFQSKSRTAA